MENAVILLYNSVMNNYKLILQYDGSRYNGWQKQNDTANTIQQILTDVISDYVNETIKLIGSGRTDAGVHALAQTANFRCRKSIDEQDFTEELNAALPFDIRVNSVEHVLGSFHARHSAAKKVYVYRIDRGSVRNIFERKYSWRIDNSIDLAAMKRAADALTGEHDFRAFCTNAKEMPYTVKNIYSIEFYENFSCLHGGYSEGMLEIEYCGSGFLYNMVRILTGTLVDVGLGRFGQNDIENMLLNGIRSDSGQLAPAKGLFLKDVKY